MGYIDIIPCFSCFVTFFPAIVCSPMDFMSELIITINKLERRKMNKFLNINTISKNTIYHNHDTAASVLNVDRNSFNLF